MKSEAFEATDAFDRRLALRAAGLLADFNAVGVLEAADVHVARRLGALAQEDNEQVLLALALAVRAVRHGSVCLDLSAVPELPDGLTWPEPEAWWAAVAASELVNAEVLRIEDAQLYLDRYWQEEVQVAADLAARLGDVAPTYDEERLAAGLQRLFPDESFAEQRDAAEATVRRLTSVITGGPGTGKTTTLARLLALLLDSSPGSLSIGLAAPTGKAAARMTQAISQAAEREDFPERDQAAVQGLSASTLHRLLGWRSDNSTRFRHDRHNPLPYDVVVVDETSMVALTMMTRLVEAMRPDARLVLVGDPDQLTSVEAGAVLKDLVRGFAQVHPAPVSELRRTFRFAGGIGALAEACRQGDADAAWSVLTSGADDVILLDPEDADAIRAAVEPPALQVIRAAEAGDERATLDALETHRMLCAHRAGPCGVTEWNRQIEHWLMESTGRDWLPRWYAGQPLIVNANDYGLGLWNGDSGAVVLDSGDGVTLRSVFSDGGTPCTLSLNRLSDVSTAHAMTVHRSQGSQFGEVSVLLPDTDSALLTRELFYTAVTRAQQVVRVIATEESVRAAVERPALRATGLAARLQSLTTH